MMRRPPRSTLDRSSAASDVYKRQEILYDAMSALVHPRGIRQDVTPDGGVLEVHHPHDPTWFQYLAWLAAVSYTHLRAHETVLDLVCRLLLEKKQQKKNKKKTQQKIQHTN